MEVLQVLRARTAIGWRSFDVVGSLLWCLPAALQKLEMTLQTFKRTEELSVPCVMCWQTEAQCCCDVSLIPAPPIKLPIYLLISVI